VVIRETGFEGTFVTTLPIATKEKFDEKGRDTDTKIDCNRDWYMSTSGEYKFKGAYISIEHYLYCYDTGITDQVVMTPFYR